MIKVFFHFGVNHNILIGMELLFPVKIKFFLRGNNLQKSTPIPPPKKKRYFIQLHYKKRKNI